MDKLPRIEGNKSFAATRNACKLCSPLGASLAFKGIEGCVSIIHGSQGCATYIRRYMISHFREPIDIASSNFSEESTVFGGAANLRIALENLNNQYEPKILGISTTCLSETIGEDVGQAVRQIRQAIDLPTTVHVSTPSYAGTHAEGFHATIKAVVESIATDTTPNKQLNLFPGMVSPADIRYLKEILGAYGLEYCLLPDYSDTLDNPIWESYVRISPGGTTLEAIGKCAGAQATVEFTTIYIPNAEGHAPMETAAAWLDKNKGVKAHQITLPIGVHSTDGFFETLNQITGSETPAQFIAERGRLLDAYVDAHKYTFGHTAVVYGEEDFVAAMCSFLDEIGINVILAASGAQSGRLAEVIPAICPENGSTMKISDEADFEHISDFCHENKPDLLIGNSKGYYIARELGIPIIRVGFPIHDRIGGQRILHLGYRGTQQLFDVIVNALIESKQDASEVGYKYM